jgi:hypothetical protein
MPRTRTTFQKEQSGNPRGRPKVVQEVRDLARLHTGEAIEVLASIMNDEGQDARARVAAASAILDRGHGKPQQCVNVQAAVERPEPIVLVHTAPPPRGLSQN